tara:strand:- start:23 stop:409 length:387 start_codon:yes stop_codon:yes gene_type:complete
MDFTEQENQIHTPNITINLREHVKTWLKLDDEIKTLRGEIKKRRNLKRTMTNDLINTMKNNDIDVMNAGEAKLVRTKHKVKAPLSKKHLISSLLLFYKDDTEMVQNLTKHIMDSRETKIVENIKKKSK